MSQYVILQIKFNFTSFHKSQIISYNIFFSKQISKFRSNAFGSATEDPKVKILFIWVCYRGHFVSVNIKIDSYYQEKIFNFAIKIARFVWVVLCVSCLVWLCYFVFCMTVLLVMIGGYYILLHLHFGFTMFTQSKLFSSNVFLIYLTALSQKFFHSHSLLLLI